MSSQSICSAPARPPSALQPRAQPRALPLGALPRPPRPRPAASPSVRPRLPLQVPAPPWSAYASAAARSASSGLSTTRVGSRVLRCCAPWSHQAPQGIPACVPSLYRGTLGSTWGPPHVDCRDSRAHRTLMLLSLTSPCPFSNLRVWSNGSGCSPGHRRLQLRRGCPRRHHGARLRR